MNPLRMTAVWLALTMLALGPFQAPPAWAGLPATLIRETAEYLLRKFPREMAEETLETLTARLGRLASRYGDDAVRAVRRLGPHAEPLIKGAGAYGRQAARVLALYGEDGCRVVARPSALRLVAEHGDEAVPVLLKHPGLAEWAVRDYGRAGLRALQALDGRQARRLAMMADDGSLARIGRTDELLEVIGRYGDEAMDFIWRNKGALAVASVLAVFLTHPEPFIKGVMTLPTEATREIVRRVDWTVILLAIGGLVAVGTGLRLLRRRRARRTAAGSDAANSLPASEPAGRPTS